MKLTLDSRVSKGFRLVVAIMMTALGVVALTWGGAPRAYAAADQIDRFDIEYVMQPSGILQAKETIVWRFGSNSGRHGIKRNFIVREKYDDTQDAVYTITNIDVSASGGVSDQWSRSDSEENDGRTEVLELKIGDPDRTISAATATYTLSYDVAGSMRTFPNEQPPYDEFFWDALGTGNPLIKEASITTRVPGGAQELSCFAGPVGSTDECDSARIGSDDVATFTERDLAANSGMSIGVKIDPGLVTDNAPHLEPDGSKLSAAEKLGLGVMGAIGAVVVVGSPLVGWRWWRKNGRDQRYAGLAPGTTPLAGQAAHVVASDPDLPIPVAFSPPRIPVAEAGLLIDGQVDTRETAATIVDLAVRGAIRVESQNDDDFRVTLLDPDRAAAPHEMVLLTSLFGGQGPGATKDLATRGSMLSAHTAMRDSVRNQVAARGWFRKVPSATATGSFGFGAIVFGVFVALTVTPWILLVLVPVLPILITVAVIRFKLRRGQRTADGRAVCDQVEGFKLYLATAEAEQLKFEEGEDIFSRYLPGPSPSTWPTGGPRSAPGWSSSAGSPITPPAGTSATTRSRASTPASWPAA